MALVSIIVPVYFNGATLADLLQRLSALADRNRHHDFEFIFVDDGSKDDSYAVMKSLKALDPRLGLVKLSRNFGENAAILAGMSHAHGQCLGTISADLQEPPEAFDEMIRLWESGVKVVLAIRKNRDGDPFFTRVTATLFNWLFTKWVFKEFTPQGIGFMLVDRQVVDVLIACQERNAHLIGLTLWTGFDHQMVQYERATREQGKSRWSFTKKFKYFIDAFTAFSFYPLRMVSVTGIILAIFGALVAAYAIIDRILYGADIAGWTSLIVVILLVSGIQMIMMGVLSEYLWRTLDATRQRPIFVIDSIEPPSKMPE